MAEPKSFNSPPRAKTTLPGNMPADDGAVPEGLPLAADQSFHPERQWAVNTMQTISAEIDSISFPSSMNHEATVQSLSPLEYEFVRVVGAGGIGEVWEARQLSLGRTVAIKRFQEEAYRKADRHDSIRSLLSQNMQAEAITNAILDHPNIVPVHDFTRDHAGKPLIAMKLVRGRPWDRILGEDWLSLLESDYLAKHVPILIDMAQAVAFAHSRGVMHRDLKPAQVMVGEFDEVLLMDWGLAVVFDEVAVNRYSTSVYTPMLPTTDTASNPAGTVAYMAPEQTATSSLVLGPWTDVYLLGATLYQVLFNRAPHPGSRVEAFQHARAGKIDSLEPPPGRTPPKELIDLVLRAMRPEPSERKITASDFVQRLKRWVAGSSRRAEANLITQQVEMRVKNLGPQATYPAFQECAALLRRAQALWPTDERYDALETELHAGFARAAAAAGDFGLARHQSSQIVAPAIRAAVEAEISDSVKVAAAHRRQRTTFLAGIVALLLIITGAVTYFSAVLAAEGRRAGQERERAVATAQTAQERESQLHLLQELTQALTTADGRRRFLDTVVKELPKVLKYPQNAVVFIELNGRRVVTQDYGERGGFLEYRIESRGKTPGTLRVAYRNELAQAKAPFSVEDEKLFKSVANLLSLWAAGDVPRTL